MGYNLRAVSFLEKEKECERCFEEAGPFVFVTANSLSRAVFKTREDFISARNATAVNVSRSDLDCYMDTLMSTHAHWLFGRADSGKCMTFWKGFKKAIIIKERKEDADISELQNWECFCKPVDNLRYFRSLCAYIARNAPLSRTDVIPTGYEWCSANLFFNDNASQRDHGTLYSEVPFREKRLICRTRDLELPDNYRVIGGAITKESYTKFPGIENMFSSASQFWRQLNRNVETDIELANAIGERIVISDEELYNSVSAWCRKELHLERGIRDLSEEQKILSARRMRELYGSGNKQIARVLALDLQIVDRIFPISY